MFDNLNLKAKLGIAFAVPLVLFTIISIAASQSLSSLLYSQKQVNHTHKVIEHGDELMSALATMETGLRGYLLTGQDEFLEPVRKSSKNSPQKPKNLSQIIQLRQHVLIEWQISNTAGLESMSSLQWTFERT